MRKKICILILAVLNASAALAQFTSAPAFPGAEGFGRYTTGGRGGTVVHVTNLNDSGTGSLRAAVNNTKKKIIVFDVGGYIDLQSDLVIKANTTIMGQTAPGDGITLRYYTIRPKGDNIIIRFLRFRRGQAKDVNDGADCIWTRNYTGVIIDHCSMSWSIDELASFYDNNNFTMQWCVLGEALANAGHGKGAHSYGGIWGGKLASFHHNMLLHMQNRVPRFNGARYQWSGYTSNKDYSSRQWDNFVEAENVDFRNCVMYNWGTGGCYGGPGGGYINIVNNYYKGGPATTHPAIVTTVSVGSSGNSSGYPATWGMTSRYFINGNYVTEAANPDSYDWSGVSYDSGVYTIDGYVCSLDTANFYGDSVTHYLNANNQKCVRIKLDNAIDPGDITTHSANTAYEKVLAYAGASLSRDSVDLRYVSETADGTATYTGSVTGQKGIIDTQDDCGGWPWLATAVTAVTDSDNDGMPDDWETANGLDPNSADDATTYTIDSKGYYTNIEVYCNSLVQDIIQEENSDALSGFEEYYPSFNTPTGAAYPTTSEKAGDACYTIDGRRVSTDKRAGIIIRNGKKILYSDK